MAFAYFCSSISFRMVSGRATYSLPEELRRIRTKAGLTQIELSERSRVSRRTLIRWESGEASPWIPELRSVLEVLEVPQGEVERIFACLGTSRGARAAEKVGVVHDRIPKLLRTFRVRAGLPIPRVAANVGVSSSTIVRWETGRLFPSGETLAKLWQTLGATPFEVEAAMSDPGTLSDDADCAEIEEAVEGICWPWDEWAYVLIDVRFISLLDRLIALRPCPLGLLADINARYAQMLVNCHRYREAERHAREALRLYEEGAPVSPNTIHAAVMAIARRCIHSGSSRMAKRGIELLDGLGDRPLDFEHLSWRLCVYAEAHCIADRIDVARRYANESIELTRRHRPDTRILREFDLARILLRQGKPFEALEVLPPVGERSPGNIATEALLWSEALSGVGRQEDAAHWKRVADRQIEAYHLEPVFARGRAGL